MAIRWWGLSRSRENYEWLAQNGAEPKSGDLFNLEQVVALAAGCEAVLHLATAIPAETRASRDDWALNDRIRTQGPRSLVEAAVRKRCPVYVQHRVTILYGDRGEEWLDEGTPANAPPGGMLQSSVEMEPMVARAAKEQGLPAVVLRFGMFYCYDSTQTSAVFESARRGQVPFIGSGDAYWSQIQVTTRLGRW